MWTWTNHQLAEAARAQRARAAALDSVSQSFRETRDSLLMRNAMLLDSAAIARAREAALRAEVARGRARAGQIQGQLATARTAADSVPLLLGALTETGAALDSAEVLAALAVARADSATGALSATQQSLRDQIVLTAHWRALADSAQPERVPTPRMPLLNLPWPKVGPGVAMVVDGKGVHAGIALAVIIPLGQK